MGDVPIDRIDNFLKNFRIVTRNKYPFQSILSDVCGQYCIYFIYQMSLGLSFDDTVKLLHRSENPDLFVKNFILNLK